MFSVISKKSKTSSSLPCSANEQVCRSWEGAQPDSQPKLVSRNILSRSHYALFTNRGWLRGRDLSLLVSMSSNTLLAGVQTFSGAWSFFEVSRNLGNSQFQGSMIAARGLTANWSLGGEKIVLYTVWFSLLVVVVVFVLLVVLVFRLLSY